MYGRNSFEGFNSLNVGVPLTDACQTYYTTQAQNGKDGKQL